MHPLKKTFEVSKSPEDYEKLLQDEEGEDATLEVPRRDRLWFYIFGGLLICFSSTLIGVVIGNHLSLPTDYACLRKHQHYSPILKEVDTSYHDVSFIGSFMHLNAFRQDAGPEVDAAWESLGVNLRALAIPPSEAEATGLRPDQVQISPKYGGGFPANVEGLHHLHCLNLLRQSLYYNYDYYHALGEGAFVNEDYVVKYHVSHCLDILRQQLMCQPDTGMLGQVWWDKESPKAFVDFNTVHKCKDYEGIRRWAEERQLPVDAPPDYLMRPREGDLIYDEIP